MSDRSPSNLNLVTAAELLGVIPKTVLGFIKRGQLDASYDTTRWPKWRISRAAVMALAAERSRAKAGDAR